MTTDVVQEPTPLNKLLFDGINSDIIDAKSNLDVYATPPANPENGQLYYDSYYKDVFIYLDGQWIGIFQSYVDFGANIMPTTGWTNVDSSNSNQKSSNEFGNWELKSSKEPSGSFTGAVSRISDGDVDTKTNCSFSDSTERAIIDIECSNRVKPTKLYIYCETINNGYFYGFNEESEEWESLNEEKIQVGSSGWTTVLLTCNKHYKKFRFKFGRQNSSYATGYIYEFRIIEGNIILPKNL